MTLPPGAHAPDEAADEMAAGPPAAGLTPEAARALLRECITVVQPGETLVVRVPGDWTPRMMVEYQDYADAATESGYIPFKVLVVIGEQVAIVQTETDDALAERIRRLLPGLIHDEVRKAATL
jgi:hypothetical protein